MRVVLVSGCGSGFGTLCARACAAAGDTVVATVRDPARHPFGAGDTVDVRRLDVTDQASIDDCVDSVLEDFGRVDVLVNNAGVHLLGAVEDMGEAEFRRVFETNFFGSVNLARAVLPAMREAGSGHVISVSSIGARVGRVMDGVYCGSKAALEITMEAMRYEVARFGVQVSVVAPGAYRTGIDRHFDDEQQDSSPYRELRAFRLRKVRDAVSGGSDPAEVADLIRSIADDPSPAFRYLAGERARELESSLADLDDAGRQEFVTRLAGIGWWLSGKERP
jgi:NAD(P)-dependent dehydrogenase (short-subunit alcohol dehydrogenase family)